VGWPSDLKTFSATDAAAFAKTYYVPSNMVISIVGDVNPAEAWPVIEKYFGRLPKAPKPDPLRTIEPPQIAERSVVLARDLAAHLHRGLSPSRRNDPDNAIYDVISMLMSNGRTSRLYARSCATRRSPPGRGLQRLPRRKVSERLHVLRHHHAGPHAG
jgi:predicted Zn-dependent peptidase